MGSHPAMERELQTRRRVVISIGGVESPACALGGRMRKLAEEIRAWVREFTLPDADNALVATLRRVMDGAE